MSPFGLIAVPEAENVAAAAGLPYAGLIERVQAIAIDLAELQAVDWEDDLARGGGPCLALGAERRVKPR
jgi:hypothetical protein